MNPLYIALILGAMHVACGGTAPKAEADVFENEVGGDCPACTSPNFDGLPPGGSPRAFDDLPPDSSPASDTAPAEPDDSTAE